MSKETPVKKPTGKPPVGCLQCKAPFTPNWPRSKWTLNGFSPWCPTCHKQHAPQRAKPGAKLKEARWTDLPAA